MGTFTPGKYEQYVRYANKHKDKYLDGIEWASKYNLTQISHEWITGGAIVNQHMARQLEEVYGVTHVVCAAGECIDQDTEFQRSCNWGLYTLNWGDSMQSPPVTDFLDTYAWLQQEIGTCFLRGTKMPHVYVHCYNGLHRGPALTAFLVAAASGLDFDDLISYLVSRRPWLQAQYRPTLLIPARLAIAQVRGTSPVQPPDGSGSAGTGFPTGDGSGTGVGGSDGYARQPAVNTDSLWDLSQPPTSRARKDRRHDQ